VNGAAVGSNDSDADVPGASQNEGLRGESPAYGVTGGLANLQKPRRTSTNGSLGPLSVSSSRESMVRVTDLKRALSGYNPGNRHASPLRRPMSVPESQHSADDSDSMVSYHDVDNMDGSMADLNATDMAQPEPPTTTSNSGGIGRPTSSSRTGQSNFATPPTTVHDLVSLPRLNSDRRLGNDVPPVPKIPSSLNLPGTYPRDVSPSKPSTPEFETFRPQTAPQGQKTRINGMPSSGSLRESRSMRRGNLPSTSRREQATTDPISSGTRGSGKIDLGKLLAGIHSGSEDVATEEKENSVVGMSRPPY